MTEKPALKIPLIVKVLIIGSGLGALYAVGGVGYVMYQIFAHHKEWAAKQQTCVEKRCPYATRVEYTDYGCQCTQVWNIECSWDGGENACETP